MKFKSLLAVGLLGMVLAPASATVEEDAAKTVDAFYNLEFDRAMAAAHHIETEAPGHPAASFYLGVAYFQHYLIESPPNGDTLQTFEDTMAETLRRAQALEKSTPDLFHYYAGAAIGFQARALVAHGRYGAAIPKARQGFHHLEQALALNPALHDANMGLGMFYYFADRVPAAVKPFAFLMVGMWGDRDKGLRLLHDAEEHGTAARMEAKSILAAIYSSQSEQQWPQAIERYRYLMERYPLNPRYRLGLAYVYQRLGQWQESAELCNPSGSWLTPLDPAVRTTAVAAARCRYVENMLFLKRWTDVARELQTLEKGPRIEFLEDWIHLRQANFLDAQGRRDEARALYQSIHNKKPRAVARQFLKTAFPDGPRDVMPKSWPLPVVPE